mgnify:CR=1 FL=1|tara:strand:+ start:3034 stop:3315 length:282 start_codon:yes stop_codon:yes gene_type:complete
MIDIKNKKFKISNDAIISNMGNHAVLLNLKSGAYFELNEVALFIVENLKKVGNLDKIKSIVIEKFDVQEQKCEDDIKLFLEQLLERDLLELEV